MKMVRSSSSVISLHEGRQIKKLILGESHIKILKVTKTVQIKVAKKTKNRLKKQLKHKMDRKGYVIIVTDIYFKNKIN